AASILSKTAGARGETCNLFNGLIAWPAQTGEDRFSLLADGEQPSWFEPRHPAPEKCGRAGFSKCVLPGASEGPKCLEVRFRAGRRVQPGGPAHGQRPPRNRELRQWKERQRKRRSRS